MLYTQLYIKRSCWGRVCNSECMRCCLRYNYLTHIKSLLRGTWCAGVFNACFA